MSMRRNIEIDGREVAFRASAAIPRIYRIYGLGHIIVRSRQKTLFLV